MGVTVQRDGERAMTWAYLIVATLFVAYQMRRYARAERGANRNLESEAEAWTPPSDAPLLSFLVPAWNAATDIPSFVEAFRRLTYPEKELILAAGGEDDSLTVAQTFEDQDEVVVLRQRVGEGKQGALRRSLESARGPLVYLTDIDCLPDDEVVHTLVRRILNHGDHVATGPSEPLPDQLGIPIVRVQWAIDLATQPHEAVPASGLLGRNAALTREAVEAAGAFATPARSGTDYTLAKELKRAGYQIVLVPDAPMPTEYPTDFGTRVRKQARWIRNVLVLGHRYGAYDEVRAAGFTVMLPIVLLACFTVGLLGVPATAFVGVLVVAHALGNRLLYLKQASLRAGPATVLSDFAARQVAAIKAGWDVAWGVEAW